MILNEFGGIVYDEWFKNAEIRKNVELNTDEFMVMPNPIHGILWIVETRVGVTGPVTPTLVNPTEPTQIKSTPLKPGPTHS